MRFGVLRNVAGNIDALTDADRRFDELGVDAKVCLGQIVGVYPYVDDCVEFLINRGYVALRRLEEDEFVGDCRFVGWSTTYLVNALKFARGRVSESSLEFLRKLPEQRVIQGIAFESRLPVRGGVLNAPGDVAAAFACSEHRISFHAAYFDPHVWCEDLTGVALSTARSLLPPEGRLLISTGGVGSIYQGSMNTRQPVAMIFDDKNWTVDLLRPMCDVEKIFDRLRSTDYPRDSLNFLERHEYEVWRSASNRTTRS